MKLTVRRKYDVREIASDLESSDELAKLFSDVREAAFDLERSDALTRLSDCQTAALDCDAVRCALTIVFCESPLQLTNCNVIRDEIEVLHSMLMSSNAVTIADVRNAASDFERSDALTIV